MGLRKLWWRVNERLARAAAGRGEKPGIDPGFIRHQWRIIRAAYGHPSRSYHSLPHLRHMFRELSRVDLRDMPAVYLAVFFHDLIYDSRAKDNEEKSAEAAQMYLASFPEIAAKVADFIRATARHQLLSDDPDLALFLDADLAILSASPRRYRLYSRQIRREYSWVQEADYREGRGRVLENFLKREKIYFSPPFQHREAAARRNLKEELKILRGE